MTRTDPLEPTSHVGWAGRVAGMAVVAAVGVSVIYLPQPIQTLAAQELGVPLANSSGPAVAVQAGYALGVVLLVSLGDRLIPRVQVSIQLAATAAAVLLSALAWDFTMLTVAMFVAGAGATVGQILVSTALRLAPPELRARTAAVLIGAFLVGLFSMRTLLGLFAETLGWRTVLVGAAVIVAACIPVTLRFAPGSRPPGTTSYLGILTSIPRVVLGSRSLRLLTLSHALAFSAFIAAWSMVTIYGVSELGLSVTQTALLGLAGLLGGATTIASARLQPRVGPRLALPISLATIVSGGAAIAALPHVLPVVVAGLYLISFGLSSSQVSSQPIALASVDPGESGRANTVFMATTFFAGAAATAAAAAVMRVAGFAGVGALTLALATGSILIVVLAVRIPKD